ncbi:exported hypothetical protein [metagenome]|uniref:Uncharacterized protein n=1 Tax=metagenome TaxID=256318 RepID=A0A2P2C2G6_9ZZZZ
MIGFTRLPVALGCAALAVATGFGTHHVLGKSPQGSVASVAFTSLSESYSSTTPVDWASTADHVAEVTAVSEARGRTEGGSVERLVTMRVDSIRWSRDGAPSLPDIFEMNSFGWIHTEAGLAEVVPPDAPRIEPGHHYLVGLIHLDPRCNADDGVVVNGGWNIIGSGGAIPYDNGDIGYGEVEGHAKATADGDPGSMLEAAENAPNAADVVALVDDSTAQERPEQPGVREGC